MNWIKVTFTYNQVADGALDEIQNKFDELYALATSPKNMAMFCDNKSSNLELGVYFSPAAAGLFNPFLSMYSTEECDKPDKDSVTLLVGHNNAWDEL